MVESEHNPQIDQETLKSIRKKASSILTQKGSSDWSPNFGRTLHTLQFTATDESGEFSVDWSGIEQSDVQTIEIFQFYGIKIEDPEVNPAIISRPNREPLLSTGQTPITQDQTIKTLQEHVHRVDEYFKSLRFYRKAIARLQSRLHFS